MACGSLMRVALLVLACGLAAAEGGVPVPPPSAQGGPPNDAEVDAVLKALEEQNKAAPPAAAVTPLEVALVEETPPHVPPWTDMVVPVLELRLRPFVRLGHPTSQRRPELQLDARGWVGAQVTPTRGITARLVVSAHQNVPGLRPPGPDVLLDAWFAWAYPAMGGEVAITLGRQPLVATELILARNEWLQLPPRFDGVVAHLTTGLLTVRGALVAESLRVMPAAGALPDVNLLGLLQVGLEDGEGRQVEMHAVMFAPRVPVYGDASEGQGGLPRLDVGGNAMWHWKGLRGRVALDLQQERFEPPSIYAPPLAFHASAGYAPHFPWMFGMFVEGGVRGALGQPGRYLPGVVGGFSGWSGVRSQQFNPLYGTVHGAFGEMDLARLENSYMVFGRVGLVRDRVKNLSLTVLRLAQWDHHEAWVPALGGALLAPGEGRPNPLVGHEVDLTATAELTRHVILSGAVGLLYSGPRAADAQFGAFAQTAWLSLEFRL